MRWRLALLFAVLYLPAFSAQNTVSIEGQVLDAATNLPVAGATVALCDAASRVALDTASADASGNFRFAVQDAGSYAVEASAPGFLDQRTSGPAIQIDAAVFESGATPGAHTVTLRLTRAAVIEGRVRDGDTKQAMTLLTVRALRFWWLHGTRQLKEERIAFTDDDGVFRLDTLPSGEYVIEIDKRTGGYEVNKDAPKVYPILLWPGNDPGAGQVINLTASSAFNTGTINFTRLSLPRLHVKIAAAACDKRTAYQVALYENIGGALLKRRDVFPQCAASMAVELLSPGRYRLQNSAPLGLVSIASADIELKDGADADVELKAKDVLPLRGKIACDCKEPLTADHRMLHIIPERPEDGGMILDVVPDGSFQGRAFPFGTSRLEVKPLPKGLYIKQVRYSGADPGLGQFVAMNPDVAAWLDITLSDGDAAITGKAAKEGKPVRDSMAVIARWPLVPDAKAPYYERVAIDAAGAFQFSVLAPGTYRVAAIGPAEWVRREEPGVAAAWFTAASDIVLAESQTLTIAVEARLP